MSQFAPQPSDEIAIATIRALSADVVGKANSGHPGTSPIPKQIVQTIQLVSAFRCPYGSGPRRARPFHPVCRVPIIALSCAQSRHSFVNANPKNSKWFNRDRFVLSNGCVCAS